jgi:hypothetical protein
LLSEFYQSQEPNHLLAISTAERGIELFKQPGSVEMFVSGHPGVVLFIIAFCFL